MNAGDRDFSFHENFANRKAPLHIFSSSKIHYSNCTAQPGLSRQGAVSYLGGFFVSLPFFFSSESSTLTQTKNTQLKKDSVMLLMSRL